MARTDRHLVVDGSNIATEGRTLPSLAQLDEAVRAITAEYTYESLTVVVDATFAHRIDESEREEFEAAVLAGEIVTPPAGAIGRGDAFILQVASKISAVVFSNDSFQEFHGEHEWLFDQGRLIGGKPIEGVGWIFVERAPVRGPASRRSVREAGGGRTPQRRTRKKSTRRSTAKGPAPKPSAATPPPAKKGAPASASEATKSSSKRRTKSDDKSAVATKADSSAKSQTPEELNDPRTFVGFVAQFSIGDEVEGTVERFASHGCYLRASGAQCYLPSRAMGDPPPTRARDVVSQGQDVIVKVESLDSDRRGINVELVRVVPRDDSEKGNTKARQGKAASLGAEKSNQEIRDSGATPGRNRNPAKTPQVRDAVADGDVAREGHLTRSTTNVAKSKPTARKSANKATKRPAAKKTAKKAATATSSARVKRAAARKSAPKKAAAKKVTKKAAPKKAAAKKAAPKKAAKKVTKKAAPKKAAAKKTAAKKATKKTAAKKVTKKAAPKKAAKKVTKKTAAKKTAAKKAAPKKAAAKKSAPKKAAKKR